MGELRGGAWGQRHGLVLSQGHPSIVVQEGLAGAPVAVEAVLWAWQVGGGLVWAPSVLVQVGVAVEAL